jgi:hypothetical protein
LQTSNRSGRLRPINITAAINLLKFQAEVKAITNGSFEFWNTRNGTRVVTKRMADSTAVMRHLDGRNLPYYIYHPKSLKSVKVVIIHLPGDTSAEDISNELMALGFSVDSVRQKTASRSQPQGGTKFVNLPLFLVSLNRKGKSPKIFKLTSLSHVVIKVESYRAQNGLTQCYNCQKFAPRPGLHLVRRRSYP